MSQKSFYVSIFDVLGLSYIAIPGIENDCLTVYCRDDPKFSALAAFEDSALLSWVDWKNTERHHVKSQLLEHLNSHDMFDVKGVIK